MVATLLRLRLATTVHQLQREWWRLLVLIAGAVWALSLAPSAWWAARALEDQLATVRLDALTAVTAIVTLGWMVIPVLITGLDDSLDPGRFASFGVSVRSLMPGVTVSAFLTIPVVFHVYLFGVLASSWRGDDAALVVAFLGAAISVVMLVVTARVVVAWVTRLLQSHRSRLVAFALVGLVVAVATPVAYAFVTEGLDTVLNIDVPALLETIRHLPVGMPVAAVPFAADGQWWSVAWRLGAALAWVVLLHAVWRANVAYTLVHPVARGEGTRARDDGILASARRREKRGEGAAARATRAVQGRALRYWFTDPRYLSGLVSMLVFPAAFFTLVYPIFGSPIAVVMAVPVLLAGTIGWARHNDVAFDSTALWIDVASGEIGRPIMRGRIRATLVWALPVAAVAIALAAFLGKRWDLVPAEIGAVAGVLGTSLGVSAVSSVALPYRAPAPGQNPFAAEIGSVGAGLLAQLVSSVAAWIVAVPVTFPLVAAIRWDSRFGWLGLVFGTATGVAVLAAATSWAGRLYDRKSGRLLQAVS